MTYVMSDIHGMLYKFFELFNKIGGIGERDRLYILGDFIDRGSNGILILQSIMNRPRIIPLIGNHETIALPFFRDICGGTNVETLMKSDRFANWSANGGDETLKEFIDLGKEQQLKLTECIGSFLYSEDITVNGQRYHLSHSLPEYSDDFDIKNIPQTELIWGEPDYDIRYDPDVIFITGHTPTGLIDPAYKGRIWRGNGHIAIDCGAAFDGGRLGCICLETMEEFYV
ncbi:MAG: metallophosphoesterase [Clostridia bacterium]|nr:metallophosphoesterase [Clostridia bacterium]